MCFEVRMTGVAWTLPVAIRWMAGAMMVSDDVAIQVLAMADAHWSCVTRWQTQPLTYHQEHHFVSIFGRTIKESIYAAKDFAFRFRPLTAGLSSYLDGKETMLVICTCI